MHPRRLASARKDLLGDLPQLRQVVPAVGLEAGREHAREHPRDIRVDERRAPFVGKAGHGAGGVRAHAGKLEQFVRVRRECARAAVPGDLPRELVQVACAGVIAEPGPCLHHAAGPRAGECFEGWEPFEEPFVEDQHPRHRRLLQHQLRHEYAVRVARLAPRQLAVMTAVPRPKAAAELPRARRVDRFEARSAERSAAQRGDQRTAAEKSPPFTMISRASSTPNSTLSAPAARRIPV